MRPLLFATLLTFVAAPAFAQSMGTGTAIPLNQEKEVSPQEREKRRKTEEAYRSTIKNIPDAKPVDPWGNMRSTDTGNTAKARQPQKKTN